MRYFLCAGWLVLDAHEIAEREWAGRQRLKVRTVEECCASLPAPADRPRLA
jgi:hypothetical protein